MYQDELKLFLEQELDKIDWYRGLSIPTKNELIFSMERETRQADSFIAKRGKSADALYLVQSGYVDRTASARDRRSARIRLTDKGKMLCRAVKAADEVNQDQIVRSEQDLKALEETFALLRKLEVLWATDLQQSPLRLDGTRF